MFGLGTVSIPSLCPFVCTRMCPDLILYFLPGCRTVSWVLAASKCASPLGSQAWSGRSLCWIPS
jgi:hypothetical protein